MTRMGALLRWFCAVLGVFLIGFGITRPATGSQGRWLVCLLAGAFLIAIRAWPTMREDDDETARPLANVLAAIALLFAMIAIQMARMQAIFGKSIAEHSGSDPASGDVFSNPRTINSDLVTHRGSIADRNGKTLARSSKRGGVYDREYPEIEASYVCGYFSPLRYGRTGLEASWDDVLSGRGVTNPIREEIDRLLGREPAGITLELTLDAQLQAVAHQLMADRTGAAILIEIASGAVHVLASSPHFDPSKLAAYDATSSAAAAEYWSQLNADPAQPLLLRATDGLYTPGSTFKTITVSAAIETGVATPSTVYTDDGQLDVDGHVINEANRPDDTVSRWTLEQGLAYSLNVVFAQVGLQLGADRLRNYAERFGFGQEIPFDLPVAVGQVASTPDFLASRAAVADTAFGQGELLTSPLGMALVAAAIANDGEMMRPYLVARERNAAGETVRNTNPRPWRRVIEPETATTVRELMVNTVANGYANGAAIDGLLVGGKTGTAESGSETPHAWFIGFVGDPDPAFAVAVVLEYGGEGIQGPLAIARDLMAAAMA